jgi:hypothetical protein
VWKGLYEFVASYQGVKEAPEKLRILWTCTSHQTTQNCYDPRKHLAELRSSFWILYGQHKKWIGIKKVMGTENVESTFHHWAFGL